MPIVLVQTVNNNYTATPHNISIASSGSGNLIVVLFAHQPSNNFVLGITDNVGNSYVQVPGALGVQTSGFSGITDIWYALNSIPGATTITVTLTSGLGNKTVTVLEYSGVATSSAIDVSGNLSNQSSASPVGPSLVTSQNNEVLVVAIAEQNTDTLTNVSSPWIPVGNLPSSNTDRGQAYLITSSSGTYQANFIPSTANAIFCSSGVAFLPFVAPPPLTLSLSDSVSFSDSTSNEDDVSVSDSITPLDSLALARAQNVSDSMTVTDKFSAQSNFISPNPIPSVETLTDSVVPAEVKTFFKFE